MELDIESDGRVRKNRLHFSQGISQNPIVFFFFMMYSGKKLWAYTKFNIPVDN